MFEVELFKILKQNKITNNCTLLNTNGKCYIVKTFRDCYNIETYLCDTTIITDVLFYVFDLSSFSQTFFVFSDILIEQNKINLNCYTYYDYQYMINELRKEITYELIVC
jgi:hypothetical protein